MRKSCIWICVAALAMAVTPFAKAGFQLVAPVTVLEPTIPGSNDFASSLNSLGLSVIVKSDIRILGNGKIFFYTQASESGFTNTFDILSPTTGSDFTEVSDINPWDPSATPFATLDVTNGQLLGGNLLNPNDWLVRFTTSGTGDGGLNARPGQDGFGIFLSAAGLIGGSSINHGELYFGYDDNGAGPDDNHDDLIIRAVFVAAPGVGEVPEPASLIVWTLLASSAAGVVVVRNRRR